jgi:hypothetical protein
VGALGHAIDHIARGTRRRTRYSHTDTDVSRAWRAHGNLSVARGAWHWTARPAHSVTADVTRWQCARWIGPALGRESESETVSELIIENEQQLELLGGIPRLVGAWELENQLPANDEHYADVAAYVVPRSSASRAWTARKIREVTRLGGIGGWLAADRATRETARHTHLWNAAK